MRVISISDGSQLDEHILIGLKKEGFTLDTGNLHKGIWLAKTNPYDLIILKSDSYKTLTHYSQLLFRECPNTFILIITKNLPLEKRLELFNLGADEIMEDSFSFRELVIKMKILTRREKMVKRNSVIQIDDLVIDTNKYLVKRGNKQILLRRREFDLLCFLFRNQGKTLTKLAILEAVWDCNVNPFTNTLEVHILSLRRKIDNGVPLNRKLIHTIYGRGYQFGLPVSFLEDIPATDVAVSS